MEKVCSQNEMAAIELHTFMFQKEPIFTYRSAGKYLLVATTAIEINNQSI